MFRAEYWSHSQPTGWQLACVRDELAWAFTDMRKMYPDLEPIDMRVVVTGYQYFGD